MAQPKAEPVLLAETVFYDGGCGLCHALVRFAVKRDLAGWFAFAPLGGVHFQAVVPETQRARLPDSVVVYTAQGRLLARSAAVLYLLRRFGGVWRVAAALAGVFPRAFLDAIYGWVARIRRRLFPPPGDVCPAVPPELRARFRV